MIAHKNHLIVVAVLSIAWPALGTASPAIPVDGTIADVAERVVDSVVNISSTHEVQMDYAFDSDPFAPWFGGEQGPQKSLAKGSGVIVTSGGRILTNAHVVDGANDIRVTLQDGTELDAKVVGKDSKADLAVIQLKGKFPALRPLSFGDSTALRLGDIVLAVGDGLGVGKSVSMGIVSAKGRAGMGIEEYEDFIQTDAAINPGNSGGALVNLKGELVGINTAIASRSGGYQGIGFAIPSNMARPIMDMLVKDGRVVRGYLGIMMGPVTPELVKKQQLPTNRGVYVASVEAKGPAARAGLTVGDVIVAIDGTELKSDFALRNVIAMSKPGAMVTLEVARKTGKAIVKAQLGELKDPARMRRQIKPRVIQVPPPEQNQPDD